MTVLPFQIDMLREQAHKAVIFPTSTDNVGSFQYSSKISELLQ